MTKTAKLCPANRHLFSRWLLILTLLGFSAFSYAETKSYNIPAGPLSTALSTFAAEAGILLSADAQLTQDKQSQGLRGEFTPESGLQELLKNTDITFIVDNNKYVLQPTRDAVAVSSSEPTSVSDNNVHQLGALSVIGTPQSRYESRYADTAMKLPKSLDKVSRSIDVIPEQLMLDQQAREMADVFRFSPNMAVADGYGGTREHTLIRGFARNDNVYRNGVPSGNASRVDPATIDNVQIIKGPVADIGRMSPGGLVNIETKQPQFYQQRSITTTFDEHGQRRGVVDLTGPVGDSDNLAYRLTGSMEDSDTFRDTTVDRQFLSSSLLWQDDSGWLVSLNHEYTRDRREVDRGLITVPVGDSKRQIADVSRSTRYDGDIPNERDSEVNHLELNISIPLANPAWKIDNKLFYSQETSEDIRAEVAAVGPDSGLANDVLARRVISNQDQEIEHRFARSQLIGDIDTALPIRIATGVEYREFSQEWKNFGGSPQIGGTVYDPDSFSLTNNIDSPSSASFSETTVKSHGIFSALDISLTDSLTLDIGLRYERFRNDAEKQNLLTGVTTELGSGRSNKLTKGAGLVWETLPGLNLYVSYADTFEPQNIYSGDERVLRADPSEGRQVEAGVKWSSSDNRYFITGAIFDLREDNVVEFVNGEPVLAGGISSKGVEFTMTANPIDGFNLRGAIGMLDAEIDSTDEATDGNRPSNVPNTTASLWASYEFQKPESMFRGLGIGSGISYASNRYGDNQHSYKLGDYTVVDAGIWYYLPVGYTNQMRLDLGIKNVTDEKYFVASGGNTRISVGAPRTVFGGVRLEF